MTADFAGLAGLLAGAAVFERHIEVLTLAGTTDLALRTDRLADSLDALLRIFALISTLSTVVAVYFEFDTFVLAMGLVLAALLRFRLSASSNSHRAKPQQDYQRDEMFRGYLHDVIPRKQIVIPAVRWAVCHSCERLFETC